MPGSVQVSISVAGGKRSYGKPTLVRSLTLAQVTAINVPPVTLIPAV